MEPKPTEFERGNIVGITIGRFRGDAGVVVYVDHENAAAGGEMNYEIAVIHAGRVQEKSWYCNDELMLIDKGAAGGL